MSALTQASHEEEHEARLAAQATIAHLLTKLDDLTLHGSILQAQNDAMRERIKELEQK